MLLFMTALTLAMTGTDAEPAYSLDYPGIAFGSLPLELAEPVEGTLTAEAGVIQSDANSTGTEFHVMYWLEDPGSSPEKVLWLEERLRSVLSPDMVPHLLLGSPEWIEGSMDSPHRGTGSLGLMPTLNFNIVAESGQVLGAGRAAAFFRNGYSVLVYCMAPASASVFVRENLDAMLSQMYMTGD